MTNHCLENIPCDKQRTNDYTILKVERNTQKRKLFEELAITKQKKNTKRALTLKQYATSKNCWLYNSAISLKKVRTVEQYIAGDQNFFNILPKFQNSFNRNLSTIFCIFFQNFNKIDLLEFSINSTQSLYKV